MRTILNDRTLAILDLFYQNKNQPIHLREISRRINLREGSLTRHLNQLIKYKVLLFKKEGNLKLFYVNKESIPKIFPLYDQDRFEKLASLRKNAIKYYLDKLSNKPVFLILFGSTAKGSAKETSDIDIIEVYNTKVDNSEAKKYVNAQTGLHISAFQMTFKDFVRELKLKEDHVIQAGLETGFPVYNQNYFYEVLNNERV
ncbi:MAG: nucleotidyltransferase domain-containing protein [Nanoarchaeota archaeon]|nr:nucleotidyltransferase domain-containing protein [Nanoarchaeota archaeon]